MQTKCYLSPASLCERYLYDPESGLLTYRQRVAQRVKIGSAVGSRHKDGYLQAEIKGHKELLHRVIWAMQTGEWPVQEIDHINGDRADNRWSNLRAANRQGNTQNRRLPINNSSGVKGVRLHKCGRWQAFITFDGKWKHIGLFKTRDEAIEARKAAAVKHHGAFASF